MYRKLLLLLSIAAVCSCGKGNHSSDEDEILEDRAFYAAEYNAAKRICNAFKDKRVNYELAVDKSIQFDFTLEETKCGASTTSNGVATLYLRVPLSGGTISWEASTRLEYFTDFMTEESTPISYICNDVLADITPTTVVDVSTLKYTFAFEESTSSTDAVTIKTYLYNSIKEEYELRDQEAFEVYTHSSYLSTTPRLYGVIKDRDKARDCGDGSSQRVRQIISL